MKGRGSPEHRQHIADRLRDLRTRSPWTQEALAREIGVTLRGYQRMESTGGIAFSNLEKLADVFGVTVDDFYPPREPTRNELAELRRRLGELEERIAALEEHY